MQNNYVWSNKEDNARIARQHTAEMSEKYREEIEECVRKTKLYDIVLTCSKEKNCKTDIFVTTDGSVEGIFKYKDGKTAVLNFASYKEAGGRFLDGSSAQEECLCHASFLYNVLSRMVFKFYDWNNKNKNNSLYRNRALYSPDVKFFLDGREENCDVITCASPNKRTALRYGRASEIDVTKVLRSRIKFVLDIAKENEVDTLILGAFGCGVFGNDPKEVAGIFKEYLLTTHSSFKKVYFCIPKGKDGNYEEFLKCFK